MHEFHAWVGLADSPFEDDPDRMAAAIDELRHFVGTYSWPDASFDIKNLNGRHFFTATGYVNRRRDEGKHLDLSLSMICRLLPGSWGLVYERDDEMPDPPGPNAFRVRVIARGVIQERSDPFLSPCQPVIED